MSSTMSSTMPSAALLAMRSTPLASVDSMSPPSASADSTSSPSASADSTPSPSASSYAPLDVMDYLTPIAARRYPSPLRSLQPLLAIPGMISLGAGLPNPANFPFDNITVTFKDGAQTSLTPSELNASLQYGTTSGFPELVEILVSMQKRYHRPTLPADAWSLSVTTGSQDGLFKVIEMLVAPGDAIIVELPTYSGAIACLRPLGCRFVGVPIDADGMKTDELERVLSTWNVAEQGRKPRVVYVIPVGHNPGGTSMSEPRKRHLLRLAQEHDLIVLEDDPYYFLNYGVKRAPERDEDFQPVHEPSLWSLDTHGRVIRFDSLSKVLSSGIRLGFVTGPMAFVHRLNLNTESSNLMVSGVAQVLALKYFQKVGPSGWDEHVNRVALFYMRRRDAMIAMCKELLDGLATWNVPAAGMFLWLHLHDVRDSRALIEEKARTHGVILVPGYIFYPDPAHESSHVRASFSLATLDNMRLALERFATLLKAERA